ncbi:hypothetical protein LCGC14_2307800 [marine sediment metagenome]|uniref:Methyltransferase domain-containing protein n=1 Tax=marine sediment metagenome TaxID=412755 RepID=A0A0F9CLJ1_9ZZZZ
MLAEEIICNNYTEFQVLMGIFNAGTINTNKDRKELHFYRHLIHKKIISRIFHWFSSKKIRAVIFNLLKITGFNPERSYKIIDVSCGYDDLVIKLAQKFRNSEVIGNDICDKQLLSIPRKSEINNITLTKRNILSNEFCENENYDLIICKNTLHHLSYSDQLSLLKKLIKGGKNVIIVEIENPLKYSFFSYIWNFYYRKFLKDDGSNFLSSNNFISIILNAKENIPFVKVFHTSLKTIKGNYLFTLIRTDKNQQNQQQYLGEID